MSAPLPQRSNRLENVQSIRTGHKAYATKLMDDIRTLLDKPETTPKGMLLVLSTHLREKIDIIDKLNSDIVSKLTDEVEIANEILLASIYQRDLQMTLGELTEVIEKRKMEDENPTTHHHAGLENSKSCCTNAGKKISLMKCDAIIEAKSGKSSLRSKCKLFLCTIIWSITIFLLYAMFRVPPMQYS